uniref:Xaa-Pro aminopeptidase 1 n=1 Tax=Lygus hesperus TaxID=30085 RepID=A0A0A9WS39_LYGHE
MSISQFTALQKTIEAHEITLRPLFCENLVDQVWKSEEGGGDTVTNGSNMEDGDDGAASDVYPGYPNSAIFIHSTKYSGKGVDVKIKELREAMEKNHSHMVVISA